MESAGVKTIEEECRTADVDDDLGRGGEAKLPVEGRERQEA